MSPSVPAVSVSIVTPAPNNAGPVTVTVLPAAFEVVISPFNVTDVLPVNPTVLMPSAVFVPMAPTLTVFAVPPVDVNVTSSLDVPSIANAVIAPPPLVTIKSLPSANTMFPVLNAIASSVLVNVVAAPPFTNMFCPAAAA